MKNLNPVFGSLPFLLIGLFVFFVFSSFSVQAQEEKRTWESYKTKVQKNQLKPAKKIFEVSLEFDLNIPNVSVTKIKVKKGYVPQNIKSEGEYKIILVNKNKKTLAESYFDLPSAFFGPPPLDESDLENDFVELEKGKFALNLPYYISARSLVIFDRENQKVLEYQIPTSIKKYNNIPRFYSLYAEERASSSSEQDGYLDITFIGDRYNSENLDLFHKDVNAFANNLLTYRPFINRAGNLRFHYVDNIESLGCYYYNESRLLICDDYLVVSHVNNAAAIYDEIVVIVNSPDYGGSGGQYAVAYNGEWGKQVFVHELGHSFADLVDEYLAYYPHARLDRNCFNETPPNPAWYGIVPTTDYFLECNYPTWYRSSPTSIMLAIDINYFNPISEKIINDQINLYNKEENSAPILIPIGNNKTVVGGDSLAFKIVAYDSDNDKLSFQTSVLPDGAKFVPLGDVTLDGKVSIADSVVVLQHITEVFVLSPLQMKTGDMNHDSQITNQDNEMLMQLLVEVLPTPNEYWFLWQTTNSQSGNYPMTFTVSDGTHTDSESIEVVVF